MVQAVALAALRGVWTCAHLFCAALGYARFRGRQGLGLGDVKLAFVAGAWLDWSMIPIAIQLAAFARCRAIWCGGSSLVDALGEQSDAFWSVLCAGDLALLAS